MTSFCLQNRPGASGKAFPFLTWRAGRIRRSAVRGCRGFSLTELLVVIAITAVLGGLSMVGIRSFRQKAIAATASSSLRQNAIAIQGYLGDKGRYPEAWDFRGGSGGGSWAWQIRDYLGFDGESSWPAGSLLHPRHGSKGIDGVRGWDRENLHHFAASAVLFQDVNDTKTYVRAVKVNNPTTVIMLGDAPLKREGTPSSGCHAAWWSLRDGTVNGTPNTPVGQSTLIDSVDFWMSGKAHFLFADGHVEALAPTQVLRKHFQL